jgi:tetratricopeptide (TPR) repeat protein
LSHQRLGDQKGAIIDFTNAIRINPHCAKAYHLRGLIKANLGDYRGAVSDLRYAAKYYFDQGDLENYKETRSLSKAYCDGLNESELEAPTINQENFEPITANHLFEVN